MVRPRGRRKKPRRRADLPFTFGTVELIQYEHRDNEKSYEHSFGPGVLIEALEDGSLRIYKPGSTVWSDL